MWRAGTGETDKFQTRTLAVLFIFLHIANEFSKSKTLKKSQKIPRMPNPLGLEKFVSAVVAEKAGLGNCCHENNEILGEMIAHQTKRGPAHTTNEFFRWRNSIGQIIFEKNLDSGLMDL